MSRTSFYCLVIIFSFTSCTNRDNTGNTLSNTGTTSDNGRQQVKDNEDTSSLKNTMREAGLPPIDTNGNYERAARMKEAKIEIKIFKNTEISGYGYDIILEGKPYVHQPNIPAVPGNEGFSSEEKARKVAELVSYKIRNNIMPPTVEVKELDSLGAR